MTKTYKLLKDLPNIKAGTVLTQCKGDGTYHCKDGRGLPAHIRSSVVEGYPDWFEPIDPNKITIELKISETIKAIESIHARASGLCFIEVIKGLKEHYVKQCNFETASNWRRVERLLEAIK